jgi:hypothetical protein
MKLYSFGIEVKELKLHCQRGKEKRRNKDFWGFQSQYWALSEVGICLFLYQQALFVFLLIITRFFSFLLSAFPSFLISLPIDRTVVV